MTFKPAARTIVESKSKVSCTLHWEFEDDIDQDEVHRQLLLRFPDDAKHFVRDKPGRYTVGQGRKVTLRVLHRRLVATLADCREVPLLAYLEELVLLGELPGELGLSVPDCNERQSSLEDLGDRSCDTSSSAAGQSSLLWHEPSSFLGSSVSTSIPAAPPTTPASPSPRCHGRTLGLPEATVVVSAARAGASRPPRPAKAASVQRLAPLWNAVGPSASPRRSLTSTVARGSSLGLGMR